MQDDETPDQPVQENLINPENPEETMQLRIGEMCEWPVSCSDFVKGATTVLGASSDPRAASSI